MITNAILAHRKQNVLRGIGRGRRQLQAHVRPLLENNIVGIQGIAKNERVVYPLIVEDVGQHRVSYRICPSRAGGVNNQQARVAADERRDGRTHIGHEDLPCLRVDDCEPPTRTAAAPIGHCVVAGEVWSGLGRLSEDCSVCPSRTIRRELDGAGRSGEGARNLKRLEAWFSQ